MLRLIFINKIDRMPNITGGTGRIRTYEAEASDLQSDGFNHSPTVPKKDGPVYRIRTDVF